MNIATSPRRRTFRVNPRLRWGALSIFACGLLWEISVRAGVGNALFIVPPSAALVAGGQVMISGELWPHAWVSLVEFFWGTVLGVVVGIPLGFAMARWRSVDSMLSPTVWAVYSVPRTAYIPLLLVWFGTGLASKVAFVFEGVVFPMIANTYLGVRETDPSALRAARSFSASRGETLLKVVLPSSFPYLVDGLRLGAGRGIVGVVIAELFASNAGVGHMLRLAGLGFQTAELIFLVIFVSAFGIAVSQALIWFERRVAGWRHAGVLTK